MAQGSRWYTPDIQVVTIDVMYEVTACFTSASVVNRMTSRCFLGILKSCSWELMYWIILSLILDVILIVYVVSRCSWLICTDRTVTNMGVSIGNVLTVQKADLVPGTFEVSVVKYNVTSDAFVFIVIKKKNFLEAQSASVNAAGCWYCSTLEGGTDRLSQNIVNKLQTYAA